MAIAIITCSTVGIYGRSNRSSVYYPLSLCGLVILLTMMFKLLEIQAISRSMTHILILLGFMFFSVAIALFIQILYVLISRARFPLIFQMLSGAGALMLFLILMQYTEPVRQAYTDQVVSVHFLVYLLLPYLAFIIYLPLLLVLIKKYQVNAAGLSFDKVLRTIPDQVLVFDRIGRIIDHNHETHLFGACKNMSDLTRTLAQQDSKKAKQLAASLNSLDQRSRGEIDWIENEKRSVWSWTLQPVKNRKGKNIGTLLIFSDITRIRNLSSQLHTQNDELMAINRQLSNYTELIEHYSGAAAHKEIADIIDRSVRLKLDHMAKELEAVSKADIRDHQLVLEGIIRECRLALTDIRSLVYKMTK